MDAVRSPRTPRGSKDAKAVIARLFASVNGYESQAADDGRLLTRSATYGELTPAGAEQLIDALLLTERDVFYDLGCGVGRVVLQVAMSAPVRKCVGIEFIGSRHRAASRALRAARTEGLLRARQTSIRYENFLKSRISDATVVYACSTCFSTQLMVRMARKLAGLKKDLTLVTLQDLELNHRGFEFMHTLKLKTTWTPAAIAHLYRVRR